MYCSNKDFFKFNPNTSIILHYKIFVKKNIQQGDSRDLYQKKSESFKKSMIHNYNIYNLFLKEFLLVINNNFC